MKILILGFGYVGQWFEKEIANYLDFFELDKTSRTQPQCILFDFDNPSTWENIDQSYDFCLWTFPVKDALQFKMFLDRHETKLGKIILLGTTGAYKVTYNEQIIDELSEVEDHYPRKNAEELMLKRGGIVLRPAGIYGPQRNPLQWAESRKVTKSDRLVNWVHVSDLVQFIAHAMLYGQSGQVYIAADGEPVSWQKFFDYFNISASSMDRPKIKKLSKRINNFKSINALKIELKYKNVLIGCSS